MTEKEKKEQELQAWLDQVHFGSCCSDEVEECKNEKKEEPSKEDSKNSNS
ncbi:MAG: hypothetical protein NE328_06480 [Lentisphaeraceae bacterium]|nr:hypothetical protein [Lentisphaeraceae bacterium]